MIETKRLLLRQWKESDCVPFAAMNADPKVREYFPSLLNPSESDHSVKLISNHIEENGWGLWAASLKDSDEFIGFIGIQKVPFQAHFTPAVEIGWRLACEHWGKGYATEGAQASLVFAKEELGLEQIVSFTAVTNLRSRNVMEKIGMQESGNFDHPNIPLGHPIRPQVLYRLIF